MDSTISATTNGVHPSNSSGHNPPSGTATGGRNHTSGSSSGCSSSSAASQHSNGSGGDPSTMNQTPSPSDSAVGDLESMLREKDTEINYLRETMEQNEQVIFKVRVWDQTQINTIKYLLSIIRTYLEINEKISIFFFVLSHEKINVHITCHKIKLQTNEGKITVYRYNIFS